jgi:hypothetical protein
MELFVNAVNVGIHRVLADFEAVGNLLFRVAMGEHVQYLTFAFR